MTAAPAPSAATDPVPTAPPFERARRGPAAVVAVLAVLAAGTIGTVACATDLQLLALGATVIAALLLLPALRHNRPTLPAALLVGAIPGVLALRAHSFPRYDVAAIGLLLVLGAECTSRSRYVRSTAPRAGRGEWLGPLLVLLGAGAASAAVVMAAGRARLDGAVVLTVIGAAALTISGLVVARGAHR